MLLQDVVGLQHAADQAHQSFRKVLAFRKLESVRVLICTYAYLAGAGNLAGARPFTKCWHTGSLTQAAPLPLPQHAWNWSASGWCAPSTYQIY